jgi:hypothetical protein
VRQIQKRKDSDAFWQKRILPWEEKRRHDPYLVWDGLFRWFQSPNVVKLEDYRSPAEMARIKSVILSRLQIR